MHSTTDVVSRLALGTVQFGLPYGIANRTGQVSRQAAAETLALAGAAGIDTVDTAIGYGASESVLGEIGVAGWRVISKLPPIPRDCLDVEGWLNEALAGSLGRLRISTLSALLLHRPADLLGPHGKTLVGWLERARQDGLVGKVGLSIYQPDELEAIYAVFSPEIVQAPYNVFDRRLETSGWLQKLHDNGTEIHVRSIFLQGLLLMGEDEYLPRFAPWQHVLRRWRDWLEEHRVSAVAAALGFAAQRPEIERLVVGIDGPEQLNEIIAAAKLGGPPVPDDLTSLDPKLLNPSNWDAL